MSKETLRMLKQAQVRRAHINDFQTMLRYEWLEMAGEHMGVEEDSIISAFRLIARKSAGKDVQP